MNDMFINMMLKLIKYKKDNFILDETKFVKDYKMNFNDFIFYIVGNRGKTTTLELYDYNRIKYNDISDRISMTPTKQNFSQRRIYIDPQFFKVANELAIQELYSSKKYTLLKYKGYTLLIVDGSQAKIPNTPQTREEFDVDLIGLKEIKTPKARISVMSDAKNEFIVDSAISNLSVGESVLAFDHVEKTDEIMDLSQSIVMFDRNYVSSELIVQLLSKNSNFIFRLDSAIYKKERERMKSDDEWVEITLKKGRTNSIKNEEIKDKAKELGSLNLRIVNVPLKSGEIETLLTNLPDELASSEELKDLYGERWQVEKGYDVLKNKLYMENFTGKKRITLEQDFYSKILMYNILMEYKIECNQELWETNGNKDQEYKYKVNMNILAGMLKTSLFEMFLAPTEEERILIKKEIHRIAKKNLIKIETKPSPPRNKNPLANKYPYNNRRNS